MKWILLTFSHLAIGGLGCALGIYALPILIQPPSSQLDEITLQPDEVILSGTFERERADSDFLHWGEGTVSITNSELIFVGELAPGPDYKAYLSPVYVETEADFMANKDQMLNVGNVNRFDRFSLSISDVSDISEFNTVIIWCETFGEYITSAKLQ